jgi:hypothetical protein
MNIPTTPQKFDLHPESRRIAKSFRGFQGQGPEQADIFFVGKDANWPVRLDGESLCDHPFYILQEGDCALSGISQEMVG